MKKYDITPAGLVVVTCLALIALWFAFVAGWLYLHGKVSEAKDAALAMGTASAPLAALLARTRNDPTPAAPAGTPADPVNVTLPDEPVQVTPVPAPQPVAGGWLTEPA